MGRMVISERALRDAHDARGLAVVEHELARGDVANRLRELSRNLTLTQEVDHRYGCYVFVVWDRRGNDRPAVRVCEWRDEYGRPLPLSSSLVEKVKSQHHSLHDAVQRALDANDKRREQHARQAEQDAIAVAEDVGPHLLGKKKVLIPRSQSLRMSRDKKRSQGAKI